MESAVDQNRFLKLLVETMVHKKIFKSRGLQNYEFQEHTWHSKCFGKHWNEKVDEELSIAASTPDLMVWEERELERGKKFSHVAPLQTLLVLWQVGMITIPGGLGEVKT